MAADGEYGEKQDMEEWGREGSPPRSIEEMAEYIRWIPPHERTQVLGPAVLAEQSNESPPTCKSNVVQPTVQHPPPAPPIAQAMTCKPTFTCCLCGDYEHVGRGCPESMHCSNSLRKWNNCQETGQYSILCTKYMCGPSAWCVASNSNPTKEPG